MLKFNMMLKQLNQNKMEVIISKIFDQHGKETGSNLNAGIKDPISKTEKDRIEKCLDQYAKDNLYPHLGTHSFGNIETDQASVTVIINLNELPNKIFKLNI